MIVNELVNMVSKENWMMICVFEMFVEKVTGQVSMGNKEN